jgi:uncharacterized membrane protein
MNKPLRETIEWRLIVLIIDVAVISLIVRDFSKATIFAIGMFIFKTVIFYIWRTKRG